MTETQSGNGTTPERLKKSKFETIETIKAGEFAQRNVWPDVVAFMVDAGMLRPHEAYGWDSFCQLRCGTGGNGSGGEGWHQQQWIIFQKKIGYMHLRVLHELADYPVPQSGNEKQVKEIRWRLGQCLKRIKESLIAAEKAAKDARDEVEALRGHSFDFKA